ncbi:MAG: DNA replication/repair protein RecF [Flaviflexus sp.]|uniref:DNA replication/repair protein RecF n=1 Tax=Flaviflexus sp. TaxID=1969482 RepID=UPI003F927634
MWISNLALNDFRSYESAVLEFTPGTTVFVGENGHGKTNLVEAIAYLATFGSHRVAADSALVRQGGAAAVVRAKVHDGDHETMLEIEILSGRANRARLNRGNVKPRELLGIFKAVVFAPEDLQLVTGDPGVRRRLLDDIAVQQMPRMAGIRSEYDKVLKHRTALLKASKVARRRGQPIDEVSFAVWDERLAELGAQIIADRVDIVRTLRPHVGEAYQQIAPNRGVPHVTYQARVDEASKNIPAAQDLERDGYGAMTEIEESLLRSDEVRDRLLAEIGQVKDREIDRGVNLVGPHRDDLQLGLGTLPAKGFASHGETWSYALSLRLAEWQLLRSEESDPVLILDDVFAELDSKRRTALAQMVRESEQVFITAAVGDDVPKELSGARFRVHDGKVEADEV